MWLAQTVSPGLNRFGRLLHRSRATPLSLCPHLYRPRDELLSVLPSGWCCSAICRQYQQAQDQFFWPMLVPPRQKSLNSDRHPLPRAQFRHQISGPKCQVDRQPPHETYRLPPSELCDPTHVAAPRVFRLSLSCQHRLRQPQAKYLVRLASHQSSAVASPLTIDESFRF